MAGPSGDKLIYVDMSRQTTELKPFPEAWKLLGGRALSAKILLAECNPKCDALGPDNVLVMAPGVLSGTMAPTSGRISIGGKSPLRVTFAGGSQSGLPAAITLTTLDGRLEVRARYQAPRLNEGVDADLIRVTVPQGVEIQDFR